MRTVVTMRCVYCGRGPDCHEDIGHSPLYMRDREDAPAVGRRHVAPQSLPRQLAPVARVGSRTVVWPDEADPLCLFIGRWVPGFWHKIYHVQDVTVTTRCGKRRREPDQRLDDPVALDQDQCCLRCSA